MKKILPIIIILLIVATLLVFMIPTLRVKILGMEPAYQFIENRTTEYDVKTTMDLHVETENVPPVLADKFKGQEMSSIITQEVTRVVKSSTGNIGTLDFVGRMKNMTLTIAGAPVDMGGTGKESNVELKVTPSGEIMETRDISDGEALKSSLEITQLFRFPGKAIKPGATWSSDVSIYLYPGTEKSQKMELRGKLNYKFEKMEKYKKSPCILISFSGDLEPIFSGESTFSKEGAATCSGSFHFDTDKGEIVDSHNQIEITTSINLKGALGQALEMTSKFKIMPKIAITIDTERVEK